MYQALNVHIKGILPTLMHNGRLRDPRYHWTRLIKPISSKRKRTDAEDEQLWQYEWKGGLYVMKGEDNDDGGPPCWPGDNIFACLRDGAKKHNNGKKVESGVQCHEPFPLIYKGPKTRKALWEDGNFVDLRMATVQTQKVMRCRPIFPEWELKFTLHYLDKVINKKEIEQALEQAGLLIGLSDWRRRFGLFNVVSVKNGA
jgi:hypothetical protein